MRSDMGKVAVDAYRFGGYNDRKRKSKLRRGRSPADVLEGPTQQRMGFEGTRHPGENLSPLRRWVRKQVGRRWADVYSDVAQTLKGGYANLDHVKGHLLHDVETGEVRIINGWPHVEARYGVGGWRELRRDDLYVDEHGILRLPPAKKVPPSERRRLEEARRPMVVMLDGMTAAAKVDGTWFAADLMTIPTYLERVIDFSRCNPYKNPENIVYRHIETKQSVRDALLDFIDRRTTKGKKRNRMFGEHHTLQAPYERDGLYAPSIRTMSKKEVKQRVPERMR